jgi:catechol 2,3-dioxygenase-like lactoylglutathione lyase family enzyme
MRLDHIAYRTKNRHKTADFFTSALGYSIGTEFQVEFDDDSKADCLALTPPEERHSNVGLWKQKFMLADPITEMNVDAEYHAPPEIFVSDGPEGSIVGDWVKERNGIGGIHHIAYQVLDVAATMHSWKQLGYAEFLSNEPLECPGLRQVFTKPSELTGIIYELISRTGEGFCKDNVKSLMESTKEQ